MGDGVLYRFRKRFDLVEDCEFDDVVCCHSTYTLRRALTLNLNGIYFGESRGGKRKGCQEGGLMTSKGPLPRFT